MSDSTSKVSDSKRDLERIKREIEAEWDKTHPPKEVPPPKKRTHQRKNNATYGDPG